ncbi:MAG: transglycosylase domain-containing protein, partial [Rhodoferax sp.]
MKALLRFTGLLALALLCLQLFFVLRIASMALLAPQSTCFQRSEAWRIAHATGTLRWRQQWVDYSQISEHLKRAVVASEDDAFKQHDGLDWDALEKAWEKNSRAEQRAAQHPAAAASASAPKLVGGSTITQ